MNNQKTLIKNFVPFPRRIRDDRLNGKLTKNEFDILFWIWLSANPVNGYFSADYKQLEGEFQNKISYDNIRKIISSLRKKQYIYFLNHKGRKGSFSVYPIGFLLTNKKIQTLEYLHNKEKNKNNITTSPQSEEQTSTQTEHNLGVQNHNFEEQKNALIKKLSGNNQSHQITTPNNDNENKNNNYNIGRESDFNQSFNKSSSFTYREKIISVESFSPETYGQERCWEIAKALGETDMRFILSCLRKYGVNIIERAFGVLKEKPPEEIKDHRRYFNVLVRKLADEQLQN